MRVVHVYLVGYAGLLLATVAVLWRAEVLARLPASWVALGLLAAILLGVALALSARRPAA